MTIAQLIKLRTDDGLEIVDFLLDVMQDRYSDFRICHRLQAARLLTTYGNEDAPNFIDDNPQESRSDRNGHRPSRPTKFDTELARLIRENTDDGRSIVRFLVSVMVGDFRSFRPHHRMAAARELLDRGFGKSARKETPPPAPTPTEIPEPSTDDTNEITTIPESHESQFRQSTDLLDTLVHPEPVEEPAHTEPIEIPGPSTDDNNEITIIPESHESQFRQSTDLLDTPDHPPKPDRNHHTHHT